MSEECPLHGRVNAYDTLELDTRLVVTTGRDHASALCGQAARNIDGLDLVGFSAVKAIGLGRLALLELQGHHTHHVQAVLSEGTCLQGASGQVSGEP